MKLRKHSYTKRELVKAMADGEVFYYAGKGLYYDDNSKGNPFVITSFGITTNWEYWRDWQIEVDWKKDISKDNLVLCFVSNKLENPEKLHIAHTANIVKYIEGDHHPFLALDTWGNTNRYKYATPVTAERCWNNGV